ncbi:MAG: glycoside hydrolase family 172 protein [Candidatus Aminicenantales bacterium]
MKHARFVKIGLALLALAVTLPAAAQNEKKFDGLGLGLGNLSRLSKAQTRSISPENFTGEKGKAGMSTDGPAAKAARDLGQGWKISPYVRVQPKQTFVMADVKGEGAIQQIWLTPAGSWRFAILRFYWDGETEPSVECPVGDFFASGWGQYAQVSSLPVCVNPGSAFNCYWEMPFRKGFKVTIENIADEVFTVYYQINYALTEVPEDAAYFHAQFRRVNPLPYKDVYTIVDGIKGWGHYVGTYLAWGVNANGWWGEGEIKFFMDGDSQFPTIAGTGTEDYFCGSYDFDAKAPDGTIQYHEFTTPYAGLPQVIRGDGHYQIQQRFGLYRWHIMDPIRFEKDLKVTIQALGWMSGGRYLPLQDDISSVAFWYQQEPHAKFPKLPSKDYLEII